MRKLLTALFFIFLNIFYAKSQQVVINEIQSSNWGIVAANGKWEDWIEFKNKQVSSVNISNLYLSDDRNNLKMWKFPTGTTIAANGLLVVYASGRNAVLSGKIHTNFSLSSNNSDVYLSDSNGNILDQHVASGITSKTSWARVPDGSANWCILGVPTPGASNGNGSCITGYALPPVVSVPPGIYPSRVTIRVTCPDSGSYRYTIDGKTPTATVGILKSSGSTITLDSGAVLKIRTIKGGKHMSNIWMGTYLIKQPNNISLPIISIGINPDSINYLLSVVDKINEKEGYVQYLDKKGNLLTQFGANFTVHGNYSSTFPQKSLRIETRGWLDSSSIDYRLYGKKIYKFKNFNLRNAGVDWMRGHIRDLLTTQLIRKTNADFEDGKQVLAYINGKYYGIMEIREKIDNDFCAENHDISPDSVDMLSYGGTVNYGKDSAWLAISNLTNSLNLTIDSNFNKVAKYIDLDNWIDYFSTEIYIANTDWPGNNIKWWRPQRKDGKWRYILWDLDFGWGIPWSGGGIPVTQDLFGNVMNGGLLISDLMNNVKFRNKFINRYADLMNTVFRYENVAGNQNVYSFMKAFYDTLDKEMPRAFSRWPNPGGSVSGAASSYANWKSLYTDMQIWARDRPRYARSHVKNLYSSSISDTVNLTFQVSPANAGKIRINSIIPSIVGSGWKGTYFKGIPVIVTAIPNPGYKFNSWNINSNDTNLTTSKDFTTAQTVVASFSVVSTIEQPKLVVTEINYNSNKTLNSGNWFELKNYGSSDVNLTGWVMETKTVWKKFKFPDHFIIKSGQYVVFCSDLDNFKKLHPNFTAQLVLLPFNLDNKEEQLELKDPYDKTYLNIFWNNDFPWPITADGHGRTMELLSDTANPSIASNWFNGCILGSPGTAFTPCNEILKVSEINYNSPSFAEAGDWFEIYNHKNDTLKLGGWKINDKDLYNSWKLNDSVKIAPKERLVFVGDTSLFNKVHPGLSTIYLPGFNLKNSEDVIEFYAKNDTLVFSVGYADSLPFPFKPDGKGYTLDLKDSVMDMSSGSSWRAVCLLGSPGTSSSACEGGIIVSEVNFKSASFNDAGDWFELHNTNSVAFNLGGWKMTDDTTNNIYTIPSGVVLPPFGYLVFVADTMKFKKMYPMVKNYVGNFAFSLGSKSDAIKVYNGKGDLVNAMKYDDVAPWPSGISGRGYTIELSDSDAWLSDGGKWKKSGCLGGSPGGPNTKCYDSVWVAEINYNGDKKADAGDWIELWNAGKQTVDISKWLFLDADVADTFMIPAGTIMKPNDRLVLANSIKKLYTLHDTIKNAIGNFNFGLSSTGDQVVLRDTTGWLKFGMEYNSDSTWSKLPDGNGFTLSLMKNKSDFIMPNSWTTACPTGSPGKADGACVVDLAFTEINYKSESSLNTGDWVELMNIGKLPVDLFNYKFQGNLAPDYFYIPSGKLLYPNDRIVLVSDSIKFDAINPGIYRKGNFKFDLYGDSSNLLIYDPFSNIVGKAFYSSNSQWPQGASGRGKTLERMSVSGSPFYKTSWFEGCIGGSPGTAFVKCDENPVVSEINYNPAGYFNTGQWIELWNKSLKDTINLSGYIIKSSHILNQYTIPSGTYIYPNERIIIAADTNRFRKYFKSPRVFGNYPFVLSGNDQIRICNAIGRIKYTMEYGSSTPWSTKPNGNGYTLEWRDSAYFTSSSNSWFSGCFGGSPGEKYTPCSNALQISEVNYQSSIYKNTGDWIELKNTGNGYINMQGAKVVNQDSTQISTFNIPLILSPSEYIVLVSDSAKFDNLNQGVNRLQGLFELADTSGTLYIYDNDNSLMSDGQYSSKVNWPQGTNGLGHTMERGSFSANPMQPQTWFTGCLGGSPGTSYIPCAESIVFSEINYASNSKADAGDWIELLNVSNAPIDLSSWRFLSSDNHRVHYIKNGVILKPNERFVLYNDQINFTNVYGQLPTLGEKILFKLNANDCFSIISNQSKLIYNNAWDSTNTWPDANGTSYTLERIDTISNNFNANGWMLGCPNGSPGTEMKECAGNLTLTELNASSEGWMGTGDWIEVANLGITPFSAFDYQVRTSKVPTNVFTIKNNKLLFKGDRMLIVSDSLRFALTTGITNFESGLPFDIGNNTDSIYIFNRAKQLTYKGGFDSTLKNMQDAYQTGRTLELKDTFDAQLATSWFAGCIGGSPGTSYQKCKYDVTLSELNLIPAATLNAGHWVEIHNNTNTPANYQGYKIKSTASNFVINQAFSIAAKGYGIVAEDQTAFKNIWTNVSPVVGNNIYSSPLKGRIALFDQNDNVKFYVDYDTIAPWPLITAMPGRTLEMADTASNPWNSASWFAGCYGGTPGRTYSTPCDFFGLGGMNVEQEKKILVYPNPNNGIYTIDGLPSSEQTKIEIYNSIGQLVSEIYTLGKKQLQMNETSLANGFYQLRIIDRQSVQTIKLMKQ